MKSWGGDNGTARESANNFLQIGTQSWDSLTISENKLSGKFSDGKFGPNLFKEKILELNFDKKILVLHKKMPPLENSYTPIPLVVDRGYWFIEGILSLEDTVICPRNFLIHSGYSGAILLDDQVAEQQHLTEKLEIISQSELRDSYGNVLITKQVMLPMLYFGPSAFEGIPVSFFAGAIDHQKMSVVGGKIIKRFNWIFDLNRSVIYMKPSSYNSAGFE